MGLQLPSLRLAKFPPFWPTPTSGVTVRHTTLNSTLQYTHKPCTHNTVQRNSTHNNTTPKQGQRAALSTQHQPNLVGHALPPCGDCASRGTKSHQNSQSSCCNAALACSRLPRARCGAIGRGCSWRLFCGVVIVCERLPCHKARKHVQCFSWVGRWYHMSTAFCCCIAQSRAVLDNIASNLQRVQ